MKIMPTQMRVFAVLVQRELYTNKAMCIQACIDGLFQAGSQYILIGYLFPVMGMPHALIAPMYIGALIAMIFSAGFTSAFNQLFDLRGNRVIDYHLILPTTTHWLMTVYILRTMMGMFFSSLPFFAGACFMVPLFAIPLNLQWGTFVVFYSATLLCFAIWYQAASFAYELQWFLNNIWPRRLFIIFLFGSLFIPWYAIYAVSPFVAYIFLCNPMTYIAEGWCASTLAQGRYLPLSVCFIVLFLYIALGMKVLMMNMYKRLDPV